MAPKDPARDPRIQINYTKPDGTLLNLRADDFDEAASLLDGLGALGDKITSVATAIGAGPRPSNFSRGGGSTGFKRYPSGATAPTHVPAAPLTNAEPTKDLGNGISVTGFMVDKVWDGRPTKSGKTGPGTVVSAGGVKFDTFDTSLIETARRAQGEKKRVNVAYRYDERFGRNTIVDGGLTVQGEVSVPTDEAASY